MRTTINWVNKKSAELTALGGGIVYAAILMGTILQLSALAHHV
jgi:hypothetical protein